MPTLSNDLLEININCITNKGALDYEKFKFLNLNKTNLKNANTFNNELVNKDTAKCNLYRYCELEIMKNQWKKVDIFDNNENKNKKSSIFNNNSKYKTAIHSIKKMFEPIFKVNSIYWDDIGYMLYKVHLTGNKPGIIHSPQELGINIEVKDSKELICNEAKKNGLLYDRKNCLQLRTNDCLIFYISKSK